MTDSEKLDLLLSEMQSMKTDMQSIKTDMQGMKTEMQGMKTDMQSMKSNAQELKDKVSVIENKVTDISLILENEIRVNIQRVAEGHLDLSRNLHDALKIDNEKEMLAIRVNVLETELRRIKTQLEIA